MPDAISPAYLATAVEAVIRAGDVQMSRFGAAMHIEKKGAIDLVTETDREIEREFRNEFVKDGKVTLKKAECLAACGQAPMVQINDDFYENLTLEKLDKIPMAMIIDSPWIPGYLGIQHLDYYLDPELWFQSNLKIMQEFPDIIFVPSWWMEYGMAAEPSVLGAKIDSVYDVEAPAAPLSVVMRRFWMRLICEKLAVEAVKPKTVPAGSVPVVRSALVMWQNTSTSKQSGHRTAVCGMSRRALISAPNSVTMKYGVIWMQRARFISK